MTKIDRRRIARRARRHMDFLSPYYEVQYENASDDGSRLAVFAGRSMGRAPRPGPSAGKSRASARSGAGTSPNSRPNSSAKQNGAGQHWLSDLFVSAGNGGARLLLRHRAEPITQRGLRDERLPFGGV